MRIYQTFDEVQSEVLRDLKELAVVYQSESVQDLETGDDPGYQTHELMNYSYTLMDPESALLAIKPNEEEYYFSEFRERISNQGHNPGEAWKNDAAYWMRFLHDGKFAYTYSERLQGKLDPTAQLLAARPDSRQAWIPIWEDVDLYRTGGSMRVPCSLGYHLVRRSNKLYLHYVMRSCDIAKHFKKDVVLAVMMQDWFIRKLKSLGEEVEMGYFTHTVFSLHAFAKDLEGIF